jgi:hypothetical protein
MKNAETVNVINAHGKTKSHTKLWLGNLGERDPLGR